MVNSKYNVNSNSNYYAMVVSNIMSIVILIIM